MDTILTRDFGYNSNVRVGNWLEKQCLENVEIEEFLDRQANGKLGLQKTKILFDNFFKDVKYANSIGLSFNNYIQLIPTRMQIYDKNKHILPALSILMHEENLANSQQINDKCGLSLAPSIHPCMRNSFILKSVDCEDRSGEVLKYGQQFMLQCCDAEEQPLIVFSAPKAMNLRNIVQTSYETVDNKGQTTAPLGLYLLKNMGPKSGIPYGYARFKCLHRDPNKRFETEGENIQYNTELVICHVATNQFLAAQNYKVPTIFGSECLVSVHTYLDQYKVEKSPNYWMISDACTKSLHPFNED